MLLATVSKMPIRFSSTNTALNVFITGAQTNSRHLRLSSAPETISSVHVAQLPVDVLQDLGVGLVLGSVAAQGALRESTSRGRWVEEDEGDPQPL